MTIVSITDHPVSEELGASVGRLAGLLASDHFPGADRAALKRYASGQAPPLAFYRTWLRHMSDELPGEDDAKAWALMAWGLALMGAQAHRRDRPLGAALAGSGYSEARLERLLAADADARLDLFASLVRFLANKGEGFDWLDAARLLLTRDPDRRESTHRRIAAAYYRRIPTTKEK
jgi:CRISPR system Cascade subunit CasB